MLNLCKLFQDKPCFILDIDDKSKLSRFELKFYTGCIDVSGFVG